MAPRKKPEELRSHRCLGLSGLRSFGRDRNARARAHRSLARYACLTARGRQEMRRTVIVALLGFISVECQAQAQGQTAPSGDQCEQIRAAIEQYGLEAARKHAMANYNLSLTDLRNIERSCAVVGTPGRKPKAQGQPFG